MDSLKLYITRSPFVIYITVTILIIVIGMFMIVGSSRALDIDKNYAQKIDAVSQIQLSVSNSYLWLYQNDSPITKLQLNKTIKHLNNALEYSNDLVKGKNDPSFSILAIEQPLLHTKVDSLSKLIFYSIEILQHHVLQDSAFYTSELDSIGFYKIFLDVNQISREIRKSLINSMHANTSYLNKIGIIVVSVFVLISFLILGSFIRFNRKQIKAYSFAIENNSKLETLICEFQLEKKDLEESEKKIRALIMQAPLAIEMYDANGNLVLVNNAWETLTENSAIDFIDNYNIIDDNKIKQSKLLPDIYRAFSGEIIHLPKSEYTTSSNPSGKIYITTNYYPVRNNDNEIKFIVVVKEDITQTVLADAEIKKIDLAQQNLEKGYAELFNGAQDIIYIQDSDGKFLAVNKQAEEMYGYPLEHFIGKTPEFLSAPGKNDLEHVKELIKKTFEGEPQNFEFWGKHKDGQEFPKQVRLNKGTYMEKDVIIAFAQDITAQKDSELELKKLAAFANLNPSPVMRFSERGVISYANTVSYIIFNENEIVNKHITDFLPFFKDINIKEYIKEDKINNFEFKVCGLDFLFCIQGVSELNVGHIYGNEITDRKRAEQKMAFANIKAEASDKIKSEFLAQMSHEIRTPLNTILSFSSLIKEELEDKVEDDLMSSFQGISNAGRRIIRTIDLLLNMSEIQTGTYEYKSDIISLKEDVLKQILDEYIYIARDKGLELSIIYPTEDIEIFVDRYSVQQIFSNLIDNAIKYTHAGGVTIKYYKTMTAVCIEITDTGIGISEEYLPDLFKQFTQEDQGYTRKFEGNGLGLALVKHYCTLNKATVSVKSEKGIGSKFMVKFPIQPSENIFRIEQHI